MAKKAFIRKEILEQGLSVTIGNVSCKQRQGFNYKFKNGELFIKMGSNKWGLAQSKDFEFKDLTTIKIEYSKAGVKQTQDFYFLDGVLDNKSFHPNWCKEVDISHIKTEKELVKFMREFSFAGEARITHRNGKNITYPHCYNQRLFKKHQDKFLSIQKELFLDFVKEMILPIVKRKKWFSEYSHIGVLVFACLDKNNELNNVDNRNRDYKRIEVLINHYFSVMGMNQELMSLGSFFDKEELNALLK